MSDVVVGFSVFNREIDGNVISSYASHASTEPTRMRKSIFVQYHIQGKSGGIKGAIWGSN
jgi:hypothetical protein